MAFGLSRYDLTLITRRIELPELSPDPAHPLTLIVRYAGPGNRDWESAQFRRAAAKPPEAPPADPPLPVDPDAALAKRMEDNDRQRQDLAEIFAGTALVGWENVCDESDPAAPVSFTVDAARQLLVEMQLRVFEIWKDRFLDFVVDVKNFRSAAPTVDRADLGKG